MSTHETGQPVASLRVHETEALAPDERILIEDEIAMDVRELGCSMGPVRAALRDAIECFHARGMLRPGPSDRRPGRWPRERLPP